MTDQHTDQSAVYLVMAEGRGNPTVHSVHRDAWTAIGAVFKELGETFEARSFDAKEHSERGTVFVAYGAATGTWWRVVRRAVAE